MEYTPPMTARREPTGRWLVTSAAVLAVLGALAAGGAGPAYRFGLAGLGTAFMLLRWGAWLGAAAAVVGALGFVMTIGRARYAAWIALLAFAVGSVSFAIPRQMREAAETVPPIHDITTDTDDPPQFQRIADLREDAPNSTSYGGEIIASQQHDAYPDIRPIRIPAAPDRAFAVALSVAHAMGWRVVNSDRNAGLIEAVATTSWFGFHDDVAVRVRANNGGSQVDIRSASRVGRSDLGKNAERVRAFMRRFRTRLNGN